MNTTKETEASVIDSFRIGETILTKRPKSMSFRMYKWFMREQRKWQKDLSKGTLMYKSCEHIPAGANITFSPFVGKVKDLKKPIQGSMITRMSTMKNQRK